MTMLTRAALVAATLSLTAAAPAAHAVTLPPTDAASVSFGNGCAPYQGDPCDPVFTGPKVSVDKTYPSRLIAWADGVLP